MENLATPHRGEATALAEPIRTRWKALFSEVREGLTPEAVEARLVQWKQDQRGVLRETVDARSFMAEIGLPKFGGDFVLRPEISSVLARVSHLLAIAKGLHHPELDAELARLGFNGTPNSDRTLLELFPFGPSREAVQAFHEAAIDVENWRFAHARSELAVEEASVWASRAKDRAVAAFGEHVPVPTVSRPCGITMSAAFEHWLEHHPRPHKEASKDRTFWRRLSEFMGGDVDLTTITKTKVSSYWVALRAFPALRGQHRWKSLTFSDVLKANDVARGSPDHKSPLSPETLMEWRNFYKSVFDHAVRMDWIASNPWVVIRHKVDKSELKGKPWSDEDIATVFSGALFTGYAEEDVTRIRPGTSLIKDAKFWLPILALHSGCRLSEMAESPLKDVIQIEGEWFLNLRQRAVTYNEGPRVKGKQSRRLVPVHQTLLRLGFIDYVKDLQQRGEVHLFPDLDHKAVQRAGQGVSRWFGTYRRKIGLNQKLHDLRHTFKRAVRDAGVSEEHHDLLTGHSNGSVGRKYGAGINPGLLTEAMNKVQFPTFPL